MKECRSNFAATVIGNLLYVYGGISGRDDSFSPVLAKTIIEVYNIFMDEWKELVIQNAPKLACFGWTKKSNTEIFVLGGTDGKLL